MAKKSNIDEALFRQLWAADISQREMAAALGVTQSGIAHRAKSLEMPSRAPCTRKRGRAKAAEVIERVSSDKSPSAEVVYSKRPAVMAQLARMGSSAIAIGQIAARNKLPRAIVAALAGKVLAP